MYIRERVLKQLPRQTSRGHEDKVRLDYLRCDRESYVCESQHQGGQTGCWLQNQQEFNLNFLA